MSDESRALYALEIEKEKREEEVRKRAIIDGLEEKLNGMQKADRYAELLRNGFSYRGTRTYDKFFIQYGYSISLREPKEVADLIKDLTARAEKAELERDAAIKDITRLCTRCKHWTCPNDDEPCLSCLNAESGNPNWTWRGLPQEGEGEE